VTAVGVGDGELAHQVDGLLGAGQVALLRPLPVDLAELARVLPELR